MHISVKLILGEDIRWMHPSMRWIEYHLKDRNVL
jgi:hypothetical protein